jgi:twitching motility protein PilT
VAVLDNLLRGALKANMQRLRLKPDCLPLLQVDGVEREVTKSPLDAARIEQAARELAPVGTVFHSSADAVFDYFLDGSRLRVEMTRGAAGWEVSIRPVTPLAPAPSAPAAVETPVQPPVSSVEERAIGSIVELLERMLEAGGSDLHLSSAQKPRMRLHGDLEELPDLRAPSSEELERLFHAITPERNRRQFEETHDTDFAFELPGRARFRVNLFLDHLGVGAVMRTIPSRIPTFEDLGLPEAVRRLSLLSKGLVLVTGPTGSGKSTTLAAIVDLVNRTRADHIITIEDPVEFVHGSKRCMVNQREVHKHTESFKQALRAALREDPDVVLVGEMRDLETVAIAIETAETGHLVFGTLHTSTAASTIERLVDQFPGDRQPQIRMMLSDSLKAVIAQSLLKKIGGGRIAAYEILIATPAIANLIREGKTFQIASAMQIGRAQGMMQMTDALFDLVDRRLVEPREAYLKAIDKEALLQKLRAGNHDLGFLQELKA